ncbi:hypothetical protein H9X96_01250 [Pedobacter sp. N36a]|uniref:HYC_CC_PP family protein n=1 Tax=Pedobacter sp. N36a TaxID=2767996 RepID=UPI001656FD45|nr:hypothetical protein [Pedobacter sp. N36a]MBC8984396.1 hypothetical protein [Pedobacter sp. N36a]
MKKTLLTIIAMFYLGISSGSTLHFHYCMGELVSWGLEKQSAELCEFCGMPKSPSKGKSCCEDQQQETKVDQSQTASQQVYQFNPPFQAIIPAVFFLDYAVELPVKITREALSNAPPDGLKVPVFLKNCTYRI